MRIYSINELAEILDIHYNTVRKYILQGKLNAFKIGGKWTVSESDLYLFVENCNREDNK